MGFRWAERGWRQIQPPTKPLIPLRSIASFCCCGASFPSLSTPRNNKLNHEGTVELGWNLPLHKILGCFFFFGWQIHANLEPSLKSLVQEMLEFSFLTLNILTTCRFVRYESSAHTDDRHTHERSWTTPRCTASETQEHISCDSGRNSVVVHMRTLDTQKAPLLRSWQTAWQWIQLLTIGPVVLTSYLRQKNIIKHHERVEFRCDSKTFTLQPIIYSIHS